MNETAASPARPGISAACPSHSTGQPVPRAYKVINAKVSVHVDHTIAGDQRCSRANMSPAWQMKSAKEFSGLASVALLPVAVVAFGSEPQPIERLLRVHSAVAKGVHVAAVAGQFCFRLIVRWLPSLGFRSCQFRKPTWARHN
jgi:hypothetical protein